MDQKSCQGRRIRDAVTGRTYRRDRGLHFKYRMHDSLVAVCQEKPTGEHDQIS